LSPCFSAKEAAFFSAFSFANIASFPPSGSARIGLIADGEVNFIKLLIAFTN
jgi:hypothetical protein